ncbi:Zinc finger protein weckle [Gryllus bimaculatus]|nr:Zinc finger protein weckle [Gryllus bimaculatus]
MLDEDTNDLQADGTLDLNAPEIRSIVHDHFQAKKLCCLWLPHTLTEEQMTRRVTWCREMLKMFSKGQPRQAPVYSSRGVLHTNTAVTSVMRFVCPICGKKISTKGNLKVHLETHRPKGKYGCDICGRVFKTQSNLYRHKDYHGGVQFPCGVCGRVYPTNSTLRAHSITHSDLRPHACPLCDKTFKRNQDLKCPYCPKAFASSGNCFSHRKRMHPQEVERDRERAAQLMRFENKMNIVYVKMKILAAVEW